MINKDKKKGLQFFTVALIFSTPICLASASLASASQLFPEEVTSSRSLSTTLLSGGSSSFQKQPQQFPQSGLGQSFLRQNQSRNLLGLGVVTSPLSLQSEIDSLKSSLSNYKSRLATLQGQTPLDSSVQDSLDSKIAFVVQQVQGLQVQLAVAEQDLADYGSASDALQVALANYAKAQQNTIDVQSLLRSSESSFNDKSDTLGQAKTAQSNALSDLDAIKAKVVKSRSDLVTATNLFNAQVDVTNEAKAKLDQETVNKAQALKVLNQLKANVPDVSQIQADYDRAHLVTQSVIDSYNQCLADYSLVYDSYLVAQADYEQASFALQQAQSAYDNALILDPNWVRPSVQVAHKVTTMSGGLTADVFSRSGYGGRPPLPSALEQPAYSLTVSNVDYNWGGGRILGTPFSDRALVRFTGSISPIVSGEYQFYVPADDGVQLYIDGNLVINDWYDKGGGGSASQQIHMEAGSTHSVVLYFYENGGGAAVSFQYYSLTNPYWQVVPASWLGTVASTSTTYTSEPDMSAQQPLIHDPALLSLLEQAQVAFDSASALWSDAQVSQQSSAQASLNAYNLVIDTATAENVLYAELQVALGDHSSAEAEVVQAQSVFDGVVLAESKALSLYNKEQSSLDVLSSDKSALENNLDSDIITLNSVQSAFDSAVVVADKAQVDVNNVSSDLQVAKVNVASAQQLEADSLVTSNVQQDLVDSKSVVARQSVDDATALSKAITFTSVEDLLSQPAPVPEAKPEPKPEPQGDPNVPAVITDLTQVNLDAIDPQQLTSEQVAQLQEAALVVFETAVQGSPEYAQALDALYVAAEADDIEVDPALLAVPLLGNAVQGLTDAINFLGNAGADMSPQVRKESKKIVVAAVVAGQVAQVAGTAAAAAASGAGSGGGGSSRRNENNPTNRKK